MSETVQTILMYIAVGLAALYAIYKTVRQFSSADDAPACSKCAPKDPASTAKKVLSGPRSQSTLKNPQL